jgi:peptidoglycan/xylan/chitin deacetylase (PgdA/CDA1 family)
VSSNGAGNGAGNRAEAAPPKLAKPRQPPNWKSRLKDLAARAIPDRVLVKRGAAGAKRVALTFDDGPHELTDAYLDVLDRFGARATFFVVGRACEQHPEALLRIVARGHEVAGHGFTHTAFTKLGVGALRDELARTAALLPPAATGRPLVRPPYGATSVRSLAVSAQAGYTSVLWSRDSDDCRTTAPAEVAARLAPGELQPGEIVLMHESQEWTLAALPPALEALAAAGWQAVTVGEILEPLRP